MTTLLSPWDPFGFCYDDYEIQINEYSDAFGVMDSLDVDRDGFLTFNEAYGALLPLPNNESLFEIQTADDLAWFEQAILKTEQNTKPYERYADPNREPFCITTNEWLAEDYQKIMAYDPMTSSSQIYNLRGVQFIDGAYYFLIQKNKYFSELINDFGLGDFFFTARFSLRNDETGPSDHITIEIGDHLITPDSLDEDPSFSDMRKALIGGMYSILSKENIPDLPEEDRIFIKDHLEATYYRSGYLDKHEDRISRQKEDTIEYTTEEIESGFDKRVELVKGRKTPQRSSLILPTTSGNYTINIHSENELLRSELSVVRQALRNVSPKIHGILTQRFRSANPRWDGLRIEIVEDDVFKKLNPHAWASASGAFWTKTIQIPRSRLQTYTEALVDTLHHEYAHLIFSEQAKFDPAAVHYDYVTEQIDPDCKPEEIITELPNGIVMKSKKRCRINLDKIPKEGSYIEDYFADLKEKAELSHTLPALRMYSLLTVGEMLADATHAYFNGAEPKDRLRSAGRSLYRTEFREKHPELYLSFCLFYEPDSPYYGDFWAFSIAAKKKIDQGLTSEHKEKLLSPTTRTQELVEMLVV